MGCIVAMDKEFVVVKSSMQFDRHFEDFSDEEVLKTLEPMIIANPFFNLIIYFILLIH